MLSNKVQLEIKNLLVKSQEHQKKCIDSLNSGQLQKAALQSSLQALTCNELSELLKNIKEKTDVKKTDKDEKFL